LRSNRLETSYGESRRRSGLLVGSPGIEARRWRSSHLNQRQPSAPAVVEEVAQRPLTLGEEVAQQPSRNLV